MMYGSGKSDSCVVPTNKAGTAAAEATEGRRLAKGNSLESNAFRTQCRGDAPSALERVRQAARKDSKQRFTALLHHVYDRQRLLDAYLALKRDAAAGVDGQTWQHYGEKLEGNLRDLAERLERGAYRAKPVRRAYPGRLELGVLRGAGARADIVAALERVIGQTLNVLALTRANRTPNR